MLVMSRMVEPSVRFLNLNLERVPRSVQRVCISRGSTECPSMKQLRLPHICTHDDKSVDYAGIFRAGMLAREKKQRFLQRFVRRTAISVEAAPPPALCRTYLGELQGLQRTDALGSSSSPPVISPFLRAGQARRGSNVNFNRTPPRSGLPSSTLMTMKPSGPHQPQT